MPPISPDSAAGLNPDDVARRTFSAVRKGYDPIEVQGFLVSVAGELRVARTEILELDRELRSAIAEAERNRDLDPSRLTTLLGEEMSRVLEAARSAADEMRAKAEAESEALLATSRADAERMRTEASEVLAIKTAEAEAEVAEIRAQGDELREQARVEAAAEVERGRQEGREMVAEAQKVRERMLNDLARRRKAFRQQIERLQAGRDRLLSAYGVVRETLDVATEELQVAMPEARLAAEAAALRSTEDTPSLEDLEAEAAALPPSDAEVAADAAPVLEVEDEAGEVVEAAVGEVVEDEAADARSGRRSSSVNVIKMDEPGAEPSLVAVPSEPDSQSEPESEPEASPAPPPAPPAGAEAESSAEEAPGDDEAGVSSLFARLREETEAADVDDGEEFELVEEIVVEEIVVLEAVPDLPAEDSDADGAGEVVDPDAALVARRDAAMVEVERTLSRRIKRELSDEQNELLDAVRRQKGTPTAEAVLPSLEAHVSRYHDAALPGLAAAAAAGGDLLERSGGSKAKTKVGDLADELASELIEPLRDRIENCFREAAGDDDDLAEHLRACYREWKGQRVDEVGARAGLAACNRGLLDRLPAGTLVHWIVEDGGSPSPDCDDNALAGDLPKGEPFPTGHVTPPISPHCRCLVAPRQG